MVVLGSIGTIGLQIKLFLCIFTFIDNFNSQMSMNSNNNKFL